MRVDGDHAYDAAGQSALTGRSDPRTELGKPSRPGDWATRVCDAAAAHRRLILSGLAIVLSIGGAAFLVRKISRLAISDRPEDLYVSSITVLYRVTRAWFDGEPVYTFDGAVSLYPPATWLLLWPTYGWLSFDGARVLWVFINLCALAALGLIFARAVWHHGTLARVCAGLAPLSMPAMADSFGIGQLTIVVVPLAIGAILLVVREPPSWRRDALAAAMFTVALMKPSLTVPFFPLLLIVSARLRPAVLTAATYAALTYAASLAQPGGVASQIRSWISATRVVQTAGYGNLQVWLASAGWSDAFAPLAITVLVALSVWFWRNRRQDTWLLFAVAAIVARLWTYHRVYDDAILIVTLIALARAVGQARDGTTSVLSLVMCAGFALVLWTPLQFHYVGSTLGAFTVTPPWTIAFDVWHTVASFAVLVFLVTRGTRAFGSFNVPPAREVTSAW